jgi:phosphoribosylformimino-5-aminoimidazole carboxamide ribotide isomerase
MIIYPALDLLGGRAVRLQQGRFDAVRAYPLKPAEALHQFAASGALWAHVVDLEGALAGKPAQHDLIGRLAGSAQLRLQVAGGFREREQLVGMFNSGVARVVVGSLAVKQPDMVRRWISEFGADRIVLSFDVRIADTIPRVAVAGWTENSGQSLWDVADLYPEARHLLITDIGRDGMLRGPNFELYDEISRRLPDAAVQASGGVSSIDDLKRLGSAGVIVGKAIWEGRFRLEEALAIARA